MNVLTLKPEFAMFQCLLTNEDHIHGESPGLYLKMDVGNEVFLIHLNGPKTDQHPFGPNQFKSFGEMYNSWHWPHFKDPCNFTPFSFRCGGSDRINEYYIIHDSSQFIKTSMPIIDGILYLTYIQDLIPENFVKPFRFPILTNFFCGITVVDGQRLARNLSSGSWVQCTCPPYILFAKDTNNVCLMAEEFQVNRFTDMLMTLAMGLGLADNNDISSVISKIFDYLKFVRLCELRATFALYLWTDRQIKISDFDKYISVRESVVEKDSQDTERFLAELYAPEMMQFISQNGLSLTWELVDESEKLSAKLTQVGFNRHVYDLFITEFVRTIRLNVDGTISDDTGNQQRDSDFDELSVTTDVVNGNDL